MTRSKVRSRLTIWARFVRLMVMGEGLVGEKVQMSSGVSRGDMSGSQSVEAGLLGGNGTWFASSSSGQTEKAGLHSRSCVRQGE
jgi:hypothetical protein